MTNNAQVVPAKVLKQSFLLFSDRPGVRDRWLTEAGKDALLLMSWKELDTIPTARLMQSITASHLVFDVQTPEHVAVLTRLLDTPARLVAVSAVKQWVYFRPAGFDDALLARRIFLHAWGAALITNIYSVDSTVSHVVPGIIFRCILDQCQPFEQVAVNVLAALYSKVHKMDTYWTHTPRASNNTVFSVHNRLSVPITMLTDTYELQTVLPGTTVGVPISEMFYRMAENGVRATIGQLQWDAEADCFTAGRAEALPTAKTLPPQTAQPVSSAPASTQTTAYPESGEEAPHPLTALAEETKNVDEAVKVPSYFGHYVLRNLSAQEITMVHPDGDHYPLPRIGSRVYLTLPSYYLVGTELRPLPPAGDAYVQITHTLMP